MKLYKDPIDITPVATGWQPAVLKDEDGLSDLPPTATGAKIIYKKANAGSAIFGAKPYSMTGADTTVRDQHIAHYGEVIVPIEFPGGGSEAMVRLYAGQLSIPAGTAIYLAGYFENDEFEPAPYTSTGYSINVQGQMTINTWSPIDLSLTAPAVSSHVCYYIRAGAGQGFNFRPTGGSDNRGSVDTLTACRIFGHVAPLDSLKTHEGFVHNSKTNFNVYVTGWLKVGSQALGTYEIIESTDATGASYGDTYIQGQTAGLGLKGSAISWDPRYANGAAIIESYSTNPALPVRANAMGWRHPQGATDLSGGTAPRGLNCIQIIPMVGGTFKYKKSSTPTDEVTYLIGFLPGPVTAQPISHGKQVILCPLWLQAEPAYGAGQVVSEATGSTWHGHVSVIGRPDVIENDGQTLNKSEFPTRLKTAEKQLDIDLAVAWLDSLNLSVLGELALGGCQLSQEGALQSFKRYMFPVPQGQSLKSMASVVQKPGTQYITDGNRVRTFNLTSSSGQLQTLKAGIVTSGRSTVNDDALPVALSTSAFFHAKDTRVYLKVGPTPGVDLAAPEDIFQDQDNISFDRSLTPQGNRIQSVDVLWDNKTLAIRGHGGRGYVQGQEYHARRGTVTLEVLYDSAYEPYPGYTWRDVYQQGLALALELNCNTGQAIAPGGQWNHGYVMRFSNLKLLTNPEPTGSRREPLMQKLVFDVQDNGLDEVLDMTVFGGHAIQLEIPT